jgi:predicted transcriptional regulator
VVSDHGPIKRTHILYRANLAWSQLRDSLEALENADALSQVVTKKGVFYEITETGEKILSYYADVQSSLSSITTKAP